jgi:hypothetical protein
LKFQTIKIISSQKNFFNQLKYAVSTILNDVVIEHTNIKFNVGLECLYMMPKANEEDEPPTVKISHFTKMKILAHASKIEEIFKSNVESITTKMGEFQTRGSGWTLINILQFVLNINQYNPLRGSSFIELPVAIKNKKAVINIRNADDYCFAWAVNSALYPALTNSNKITSYPRYTETLILDDIEFPMKITDIKKRKLFPIKKRKLFCLIRYLS